MEGVWARGSGGRGRRCGGEHRPQLHLTGRVRNVRCQRLVEADGVADVKAFLPVGLEHVGEAESLATHLARIGFLPGVGATVALHVGSTRETLPADLTDVRLLSYMSKRELWKTTPCSTCSHSNCSLACGWWKQWNIQQLEILETAAYNTLKSLETVQICGLPQSTG